MDSEILNSSAFTSTQEALADRSLREDKTMMIGVNRHERFPCQLIQGTVRRRPLLVWAKMTSLFSRSTSDHLNPSISPFLNPVFKSKMMISRSGEGIQLITFLLPASSKPSADNYPFLKTA